MSHATAAAAYRQNAILTAPPEKLVKLLYEGAIRHLERSRVALSDGKGVHSAQAGESLGKAFSIVAELRSCLNHEKGGELAQDLERLYEFTLDQISAANVTRTAKPVENSLRVIRALKEGWDGIVPN